MKGLEFNNIENNPSSIEKEPFFVYQLFMKGKGSGEIVYTNKSTDSKIDLGNIYNLYVGFCIEKNQAPMSIEDLSMTTVVSEE